MLRAIGFRGARAVTGNAAAGRPESKPQVLLGRLTQHN
jgi:hypothetical protein